MAGVTGALGVAVGAFGAHALPQWLKESGLAAEEVARRMDTLQIGVRYQMYHAAALLGVALLARHYSGRALLVAGTAFLLGVFIFSGLLYAIAITGIKRFGMVVPLGGVLLITGWIALVFVGMGSGDRPHET